MATSLMKYFKCLLIQKGLQNKDEVNKMKQEELIIAIDAIFLYACIWTIGAGLDSLGRKNFDAFFKKLMNDTIKGESKKSILIRFDKNSLPSESTSTTVYDYYLDEKVKWKPWKDILDKPELIQKLPSSNF